MLKVKIILRFQEHEVKTLLRGFLVPMINKNSKHWVQSKIKKNLTIDDFLLSNWLQTTSIDTLRRESQCFSRFPDIEILRFL